MKKRYAIVLGFVLLFLWPPQGSVCASAATQGVSVSYVAFAYGEQAAYYLQEGDVSVTAYVSNPSNSETMPVTLLLGVYNGRGSMIGFSAAPVQIPPSAQGEPVIGTVNIPYIGEDIVLKAFLWESSTIRPLSQVAILEDISKTRLTWAPPVLENPIVKTLCETDSLPTRLDDKRDYLVILPKDTTRKLGIQIRGGRNVVIIGGQIEMPDYVENNSDISRAIYVKKSDYPETWCERVVHIEGVLMTGTADSNADFIAIADEKATVQVQNCRVEDIHGAIKANHGDVIQPWGGIKELRVDRLTASSNYQGLFLPEQEPYHCGRYSIKNVNLKALPQWFPAQNGNPASGGGHMLWLSTDENAVPMMLQNVYIEPRTGWRLDKSVWPDRDNAVLEARPQVSDGFLTWPGLDFITGGLYDGKPFVNGEFVPTGIAGLRYVSPGYVE